MFSISIEESAPTSSSEQPSVYGRIVATGLNERFLLPVHYWGPEEYSAQWLAAIDELLSGANRAVLVTSICPPDDPDFGMCWVLYREGKTVYVQNCLLFPEQLSKLADRSELTELVGPRQTVSEDGEQISEWRTTVADIAHFRATATRR